MITIRFTGRKPSPEQSRIGMETSARKSCVSFCPRLPMTRARN